MPKEIVLNQVGFDIKVKTMQEAGQNITTQIDKPNITGEMPTLQKYIDTYEEIQQALTAYKALLDQDVERLNSAKDALFHADSQLVR